jgi:hypothetical protein
MDAVTENINVTIVVLAIFNIKILKTINYRLIRIEIVQVFCPNFPRRFLKIQNLDKTF